MARNFGRYARSKPLTSLETALRSDAIQGGKQEFRSVFAKTQTGSGRRRVGSFYAQVCDKDKQVIPRHAGLSTTQVFEILPNRGWAEAVLKKLDKTLRTKYGIKA
jgi:hypothetical protein